MPKPRKRKNEPNPMAEAAELRSLIDKFGEVGREAWQWRKLATMVEHGGAGRFLMFAMRDVIEQGVDLVGAPTTENVEGRQSP